jgi:hypothetical protein
MEESDCLIGSQNVRTSQYLTFCGQLNLIALQLALSRIELSTHESDRNRSIKIDEKIRSIRANAFSQQFRQKVPL